MNGIGGAGKCECRGGHIYISTACIIYILDMKCTIHRICLYMSSIDGDLLGPLFPSGYHPGGNSNPG